MRRGGALGPDGAFRWRRGCSVNMRHGWHGSSHGKLGNSIQNWGSCCSSPNSQRVSHGNGQVNALAVVAPAALAAAVYDAALATSLAASLAAALATAALSA